MENGIYKGDCIKLIKDLPDNYFDAIVLVVANENVFIYVFVFHKN